MVPESFPREPTSRRNDDVFGIETPTRSAPMITKHKIRRSAGKLHIPAPSMTVLAVFGALVALWAPVYLAILSYLGNGPGARSEALEWSLVVLGAFGLGRVLHLAWRDTRDPAWRAAHGLPQLP